MIDLLFDMYKYELLTCSTSFTTWSIKDIMHLNIHVCYWHILLHKSSWYHLEFKWFWTTFPLWRQVQWKKHLTFTKRLPIPETCDVSCRIVLRPDRETIRSSGHALNETSTPKKLHYLVETKISKWESTHEMFAVVIATAWCPSRSGIITMATGPHHVMSLEGYSGFSR